MFLLPFSLSSSILTSAERTQRELHLAKARGESSDPAAARHALRSWRWHRRGQLGSPQSPTSHSPENGKGRVLARVRAHVSVRVHVHVHVHVLVHGSGSVRYCHRPQHGERAIHRRRRRWGAHAHSAAAPRRKAAAAGANAETPGGFWGAAASEDP